MRRSDYLEEMKNNFLTFFGCVSTESTELNERLEIEDIIKNNEIQLEKMTSTTSTTEFTQESSQEIVTGEKSCDKEIAETIDGIVSLVIQAECSYVLPETDNKNNDEKVVIDKCDDLDEIVYSKNSLSEVTSYHDLNSCENHEREIIVQKTDTTESFILSSKEEPNHEKFESFKVKTPESVSNLSVDTGPLRPKKKSKNKYKKFAGKLANILSFGTMNSKKPGLVDTPSSIPSLSTNSDCRTAMTY